ncbi:hypothetical protein M1D89_08910 [Arthrobacter sp. D3-18]
MSALSTISTPTVHGRRSAAKFTQATTTAAVKQSAAATATAANDTLNPSHVINTSGAGDEATA